MLGDNLGAARFGVMPEYRAGFEARMRRQTQSGPARFSPQGEEWPGVGRTQLPIEEKARQISPAT